MTTTVAEPKEKKEKKITTEIQKRRNQPARRAWRIFRKTWFYVLLGILGITSYASPEFLNLFLNLLSQMFRMLAILSVAILQFVAIFWFMARSKVEIVTPEDPKVLTFDDYKGQEKLLEMVKQWMSLLSDRSKFKDMGGQFINGLLFYGPPGTGKTMLAKCMAGESGTAFISIEGSGFRAMFWGVDVLKMISFTNKARKLAREYGACIAFIDEIDAVGASRGGVMGGGNATMGAGGAGGMMGGGTGALTRLLYEMDGVGEKTKGEVWMGRMYKLLGKEVPERDWHVLYVGSTNRPQILDAALTRPGRFDRSIMVAPPDRVGRKAVIEYYISKIKTDGDIDIEAIVADTTGYTPAQIMAAITKDAVRLALFDDRETVSQRDIDLAFQEQTMGLENPIEDMKDDQKEQVAYHEAGHALAMFYMVEGWKIVRATIVRRSNALGYVLPASEYEKHTHPVKWYISRVIVSLAGDVATKLWSGGEPWVGTASDFQQVRGLVNMLANNGFFGPPIQELGMEMREEESYGRFAKFWYQAETATEKLLKDHWDEVDALAKALVDKGDLSGKEVVDIIQSVSGKKEREFETWRLEEFSPPSKEEVLQELQELALRRSKNGRHKERTEEPAGSD